MEMIIEEQIKESIDIKAMVLGDRKLISDLYSVCDVCLKAYRRGNKMLIAGNGGSAADAQHLAGELVSKFYFDRPALPAIALTTDTSILTAIGNDYGFDNIFSRQIEANGVDGDILVGISTSGNSPNITMGIETAKSKGIITVGLTGQSECKMDQLCDYIIKIPSSETPRVQESHIMVGHIICEYIEYYVFPKECNYRANR